jgi:hypothetical protein
LLLACWHRDLLTMFAAFRRVPALALVSPSRDADLLCALLSPTAVEVVRGSSSRGSLAARHLVRRLERGGVAIMALDGPRGPAGLEKPGSAWLARRTGAGMLRLEFEVASLRLHDWSGLRLPLPGSVLRVRSHLSLQAMTDTAAPQSRDLP